MQHAAGTPSVLSHGDFTYAISLTLKRKPFWTQNMGLFLVHGRAWYELFWDGHSEHLVKNTGFEMSVLMPLAPRKQLNNEDCLNYTICLIKCPQRHLYSQDCLRTLLVCSSRVLLYVLERLREQMEWYSLCCGCGTNPALPSRIGSHVPVGAGEGNQV